MYSADGYKIGEVGVIFTYSKPSSVYKQTTMIPNVLCYIENQLLSNFLLTILVWLYNKAKEARQLQLQWEFPLRFQEQDKKRTSPQMVSNPTLQMMVTNIFGAVLGVPILTVHIPNHFGYSYFYHK